MQKALRSAKLLYAGAACRQAPCNSGQHAGQALVCNSLELDGSRELHVHALVGSTVFPPSSAAFSSSSIQIDRPPLGGASADTAILEPATGRSMNAAEVAKFSALASEWWDLRGPMAPLHSMNPVRTAFAREALCRILRLDGDAAEPLAAASVLDVGCGGGLFSEPLARLGAQVTGIDAAEQNVTIAHVHAAADPLIANRTLYRHITAEQLAERGGQYDAVIASEVIEHVDGPREFAATLAKLTKPGGALIFSTLNHTLRSYLLAVVGAERVLGVLPQGTHDWNKFLTPDALKTEDLVMLMEGTGAELESAAGMTLNPLTGEWSLTDDLAVNYITAFKMS